MISEFWIIHSAICIYHKILVSEKDSLNIDRQLFGGFFSALVDFSKTQLHGGDYLKDINFMNSSFAVSEFEKVIVIYRLVGQMNEKRYKQFVQPISEELSNIIKTNIELAHLRANYNDLRPKTVSLQDYNILFDSDLKEVLLEFQLNQYQIQMIDALSLVQLKDEFQDLLVKMGDRNSIFYAHETLQEYSKITKEVVSSKAFPLVSDDFLNLNLVHTELREFIETLFTYATGIASKLKDASKPNDKHLEKLILKFINKNYLILKQFILDEIFFQGFLRSLSFNNDFILK